MSIKVFPAKQGSRGAKALAQALGGRVLLREGSRYRRKEEDLIINWGATDSPFKGRMVANQPEAIALATNKLTCFQKLAEAGVRTPAFTTDKTEAARWLDENVCTAIMCRTLLRASEGRGIVVAEIAEQLVDAPLYTNYVKKQDEYRIHVLRRPGADPEVISVQRKAKRREADNVDYKIRNLANGFVFVREGVAPPADVLDNAKSSVQATGLAFGAVDVIWNERRREAYVLEINTAPGLEGQTVEDYANAFRQI